MYKTFNYKELVVILPYLEKFSKKSMDESDNVTELLDFLHGVIVNDHNTRKMYKFDFFYFGPPPNNYGFFVFKENHDYDGPEAEKEEPPVNHFTSEKNKKDENTNYDHTRMGGNSPTVMPNNQTAGPAKTSRNEGTYQVRT